MPEYRGLLPASFAFQALEGGVSNHVLGTLAVSGSLSALFLPRLRSPEACVHPVLVFAHPTLEEVLEMPILVTDINITSKIYLHNCVASPIPPPDPICQTVSFEFDLFLDPDIHLDLDCL